VRRFVFDKARINAWLWQRVGRDKPWPLENEFQAVGIEEDGELIAGVVFDSFARGARCSMHCAGVGKRWCSRELLNFCFGYVFRTAGCKVVVNTVAASNEDSLRFTKHVGFKEIGRVKDGSGDSDMVILALHRDECRWLGA
jgi:RimJ/RimL family protein N-acetyltransferase